MCYSYCLLYKRSTIENEDMMLYLGLWNAHTSFSLLLEVGISLSTVGSDFNVGNEIHLRVVGSISSSSESSPLSSPKYKLSVAVNIFSAAVESYK